MLLFTTLLLLIVLGAAAAEAVRRLRLARRENETLRSRLERFELHLQRTETPRSVDVTALRRESQQVFLALEAERLRDVFAYVLADCRDAMGAEEVVLWTWNEEQDALRPEDWSTEGPCPAFFDADAWGPLVAWSLEESRVQIAADAGVVRAATVPVMLGDTQLGVLSVTNRQGLTRTKEDLRHWMPRLATQVAHVRELVSRGLEYGRHLRRSSALLKAVQRLEADPNADAVARSLCETAVVLTGARGAALVKWSAAADRGALEYATAGLGLRWPNVVGPDTQVAEWCRHARPVVLEDARGRTTAHALYGVGRSMRDPGSVALVPIIRRDVVLGALILEAHEVNDFGPDITEELAVLLAVAAGALELAWSYGEVDKRSRTDPLTGLYNRAHFGEQLEEKLEFASRHEQPVSLVMVDVDHFKRVNDTFGHEAGDAVLRRVAALIQEEVRSTDVCARYGGEEIAVLLPGTPSESARELAERLRERIASNVAFHKGAGIPVTASFGVATYPEAVTVRDDLFPRADEALYRAKADGRNCVRVHGTTAVFATG